MIYCEQREGLDELSLDGRGTDRDQRLPGKYRRTLRNGINVAGKAEILQIGQKLLVKELPAAKIGNILRAEMEVLDILDKLLQPRGNGKTAAVRHPAEKYIKVGDAILVTIFEIPVAHGQLVKIAEHGHVQLFLCFHPHTSKLIMYWGTID